MLQLHVLAFITLACLSSQSEETGRHTKRFQIEQGVLATEHFVGTKRENETFSIIDRMAHWRVPGMSLAVMTHEEVKWAAGYGHVTNGGVAVDTNTWFQIGNINEMVTEALVMQLWANGTLNLDEDANTYLTTWQISSGMSAGSPVTVRELLSQTRSLEPQCFKGHNGNYRLVSTDHVLDSTRPGHNEPVKQPLEPGSPQVHSGGSLVVLQKILEDIYQKPFAILAQNELLTNGMSESTLPDLDIGNVARGHSCHEEKAAEVQDRRRAHPKEWWVNCQEVLRYLSHITRSLKIPNNSISNIQIKTSWEMWTPGRKNAGKMNESGATVFNGFYHLGHSKGYCSLVVGTGDGRGVAVFTNQDCTYGLYLIAEVYRTVLVQYKWHDILLPGDSVLDVLTLRVAVKLPTKNDTSFEGTYILPDGIFPPSIALANVSAGCVLRNAFSSEVVVTSSRVKFGERCSVPYYPCAYKKDRYCPFLYAYNPGVSTTFTFARASDDTMTVTGMVLYLPDGSKIVAQKAEYVSSRKMKIGIIAGAISIILIFAAVVVLFVVRKLVFQARSPRRTRRREYTPFNDPNDLLF
ncbi:uncharacterized protein LOC106167011 isoform X2 [Lingula anatina]|uniref:Uncharacterized protein LOC106167011 isoform X2 n=1 Tax=Lingula anatina TaxID=7574 RepID=A0A1S3IT81_LINAN|nr:uncharacterized protein LOC106167011 isoform X2 [Lingula anatina]|eukprot:XP_013401136.1 uncharacterized protein LOC106167011 isoform X2 [Lingula anatina]